MDHEIVQLLDLPDEILLTIMRKLPSIDALYSFIGINQRLDQMARSIEITKFLNFLTESPCNQFLSSNRVKFDRICDEILPQIHHNIEELALDFFFIEHILPAYTFLLTIE
jgi:hypothetical protein